MGEVMKHMTCRISRMLKDGRNIKLTWWVMLVFGSDRISKILAQKWGLESMNAGGVLGVGEGWIWLVLGGVILGGLTIYFFRAETRERLGLVIIITAGWSNLVDRVYFGAVIDWIHYPLINVVGNVADIWLGIGAVLLARNYMINQKGR